MTEARTPVEVRPAEPHEQAACEEVDMLATKDLRAVYRPSAGAEAARNLIAPRLQRLVATIDERVVGTVQYYPSDDCVAVLGLAVHPQFRRRGVARTLVHEIERLARTRGAAGLTLYTVRQTGNVPVFESMGFSVQWEKATTIFESTTSSELTEVFMRKDLP